MITLLVEMTLVMLWILQSLTGQHLRPLCSGIAIKLARRCLTMLYTVWMEVTHLFTGTILSELKPPNSSDSLLHETLKLAYQECQHTQ